MVEIPDRKPSTLPKASKKKEAVNSSGRELDMALIVAPRTPLFQPLPRISEIREILSLEYQIRMLENMIPRIMNTA